jgi:sulfatase maturation enzyme AslB (radical SAM superfamily)
MLRGQRDGSVRPYSRLSRPEPLLFLPSSLSIVLTRLSEPRSRPTTSQINCVLKSLKNCKLCLLLHYCENKCQKHGYDVRERKLRNVSPKEPVIQTVSVVKRPEREIDYLTFSAEL